MPLTKDLEESGVEIMYNVCADELLCSDAGVVEGISGVRPDGSRVTVNAKSVVLCTGGYAQNKEMMERYAETTEGFMTLVPTSNTGDGLVMAEAVGAQIFDSPATQVIYVSKTSGVGIKEEAGLIVNARGERVVNEYTYQYHVGQGIANSGCSYGYYIASAADPNPTVQYGLTLENTPMPPLPLSWPSRSVWTRRCWRPPSADTMSCALWAWTRTSESPRTRWCPLRARFTPCALTPL